ncbi:hypothetical protein DKY63_06515 [Pseudomonas putida]|uniref:Uncharacterized protein n=1 Tax=Pseudomonas putida TaxID=303 RepID=A0A2Z4RHX3_PSEPU|nr:hypothetical protein DKY63_06515 [Pseudomonas putida]
MQGQYGVSHEPRKCTFQSQDCTFQRQYTKASNGSGSYSHRRGQAQSSQPETHGLVSGLSLFAIRKIP